MYKILLLVLWTELLLGSLEGKSPWQAFVEDPNAKNFDVCQSLLVECSNDSSGIICSRLREALSRDESFGAILKMAAAGNLRAMSLCAQFYPVYPGWVSDIEEIDAALAKSTRVQPRGFLDVLDRYPKESPRISQIICSLGQELVDDHHAQVRELKRRIQVLEELPGGIHPVLKRKCLNALRRRVSLLENSVKQKE